VQVHDPEFAPSLEVVLNETLPALEELRAAGKLRWIGITGYPLSVLRALAERAPAHGVRVDTAISYCRYNLHCTELLEGGTAAALAGAGVALLNASPLSMGLLTVRGPPPWHPARPALKERCAAAAAYATERGADIAHLALAFCLAAPPELLPTTLISTASLARLEADCDAACGLHPLTPAEEALTAKLRAKFFDAASEPSYAEVQAWEGVETERYWAKLGRELMAAHYARLAAARAAGAAAADAAGPQLPTLAESVDATLADAAAAGAVHRTA
jgi:L-galactose dehydrogenase